MDRSPATFLGRKVRRYPGTELDVTTDAETGFVVRVSRIGPRGAMLLEGLRCGFVPGWQRMFE
jgi:hypothetical protein